MGCGIYCITNKINDKRYIGSSIDVDKRIMQHKYALRSKTHSNKHLQASIDKYGMENFEFNLLEACAEELLFEKENWYINFFSTCLADKGFNLATVNEFRRNNFNNEIKVKNSKYNLKLNGNFISFIGTNILTNENIIFDNLVEAADYLLINKFANGKLRNIRQKLSYCLRGIKVNNGANGSIRRSAYKHNWQIIN